MEQLAATPVGRLEVVLGKLLPYLAIGLFDVAVTVVAGMLIFGTPFHGSVLLLGAMTLLFLVGALGLGIFISAAVKSQVLATQVAMVATYLPALLLSGFLFDIAAMPRVPPGPDVPDPRPLLRDGDPGGLPQGRGPLGALAPGRLHAALRGGGPGAGHPLLQEGAPVVNERRLSLLRIRRMVAKELRQLFRDPMTMRMIFGAPIIQLLLFGYAVNTDVRNVATFLVDHDHTMESRALVDAFTASGYFRVVGSVGSAGGPGPRPGPRRGAGGAADPARASPRTPRPGTAPWSSSSWTAPTPTPARWPRATPPRSPRTWACGWPPPRGAPCPAHGGPAHPGLVQPVPRSRVYNVPGGHRRHRAPHVPPPHRPGGGPRAGGGHPGAAPGVTPVRHGAHAGQDHARGGHRHGADHAGHRRGPPLVPHPAAGLDPGPSWRPPCSSWRGSPSGSSSPPSRAPSRKPSCPCSSSCSPPSSCRASCTPSTPCPLFFKELTLLNPLRHFLEVVRAIFLKGAGFRELWPQFTVLAAMAVAGVMGAARRFKASL